MSTSASAAAPQAGPSRSLPTKRPLSGIFAIDKPSGPTSMAILEELKPLFASSSLFLNPDGSLPDNRKPSNKNRRGRGGAGGGRWGKQSGRKGEALPPKLGQGGTLDPLASGVLVIGVGEGTKKLQSYLEGGKEYLTVGLLGSSTTSYDALEPVMYRESHAHVTPDNLASHLSKFRGSILQAPPLYSALRIDGMRLFEYARQGKELPRPIEKRKVEIKELKLNAWYPAGSHEWKPPAREVPDEEKALVGKVRQLAGEKVALAPATEETSKANEDTNSAKQGSNGADQGGDPAAFGLIMSVGGGTYVRSIVHDLAQEAKSAAHVVALRRTRQGRWATDRWYVTHTDPSTSDWTDKEELAGPPQPGQHGLGSGAVETVKGNCIRWSVFEEAIKAMKNGADADESGDAAANGEPVPKKRRVEGAVSRAEGLQEWERILLEQ
ncbi:pseudouridine synthase pus4 [Tilletia horrida]|nr:pseudouridine synthase pus4 [Tilletia horrida]